MSMFKKISIIFAALMVFSLITSCAPPVDCTLEENFCVGFVTDTAGIADRSFNQTQWEGVKRAGEELGVHVQYAASTEASQYGPNLTTFANEGYDLIVASGFFLSNDLSLIAPQYPDINFVIGDDTYPDPDNVAEGNPGYDACIENTMGMVYKTDQAAYLAGYLAAGMTETGIIGFFGGAKIPTVVIFGVGIQKGIEAYNEAHDAEIELIGWDSATGEGSFTLNFTDMTVAQQAATSLFDEGADIVIGVGGLIGSTVFPIARERGGYGLWVDVDGLLQFPEYSDVILTSIMKNMAQAEFDVVKAALEGNFEGCTQYVGEFANNGVQLGPISPDIVVPEDLMAEIEALQAQIASGEITDCGCLSYPEYCPYGVYPEQ
jgi:basic membrane protein A